jgi:hypothetical protein
MTTKPRKVSEIHIRPACPARLAAARLRRAFAGPILAAPPVRAIQASHFPKSRGHKKQIVLNYEAKSVYKEKNYWLVLTRTLLAVFNAPIDTLSKNVLILQCY